MSVYRVAFVKCLLNLARSLGPVRLSGAFSITSDELPRLKGMLQHSELGVVTES